MQPRARHEPGGSRGARPQTPDRVAPAAARARGQTILVCLTLAIAVCAVYGQMAHHEFIAFDDNEYIYENPHVSTGLTPANIGWAVTAFYSNNWHPVTWVSHMVDCQLFGLQPGAHHLMGAWLHLLNVLVLFLLLRRITGTLWRSAFVAAAFGLHPMHVESVAWAAERKDVLSTLLGLLTIWAYVWYARRPAALRYVAVLLLFALGIMAKPMLVTLPFVLLLLDYWPLGRVPQGPAGPVRAAKRGRGALLLEKLPMFLIVIASSVLTLIAQSRGGVVRSLEEVSTGMRIANALVSWVRYAFKLLVPLQQAFYYPYPRQLPLLGALGACLVLALVTVYVWRVRRARPYAVVGWLWFVGTLVPVIGIVQVATQAIADRYSYFPSIGLFMLVTWGLAELSRRWPRREAVVAVGATAVLLVYGAQAWGRTRDWRDGVTLFRRDVQIIPDNTLANRNLGVEYFRRGQYEDAIAALQNVLRIYPNDDVTLFDSAISCERLGKPEQAERLYREALASKPNFADAHYNLGSLLNRMGKPDQAVVEFQAAIRLKPDYAAAYNNLGNALSNLGRYPEAIANYTEAVRRDPSYAEAYNNLGTALRKLGRYREAQAQLGEALRRNPDFAAAHFNLAVCYLDQSDSAQAMAHFDAAARLDPKLANPLRRR